MRRWSELERTKKRVSTLESDGIMKHGSASRLTETNGSRLAVGSRPYIVSS